MQPKFRWKLFIREIRAHLEGNIRPAAECNTPAACAPQIEPFALLPATP
jgi:hypothetical protein